MKHRMAAVLRALGLSVCAFAAVLVGTALPALPRPVPPIAGPELFTGQRVGLDRFAGRPVVVALWASWCGGCVEEAPALVRFHRRHPRIAFLGIDNDESRSQGQDFARRQGLPGPSIFDPTKARSRRLGASGLPTTFFLDRRHRIAAEVVGRATNVRLERGLRSALSPRRKSNA
jgi:cytochrome c biogenesis protein CcmG, thiol:disulfide interchange protein DsbE